MSLRDELIAAMQITAAQKPRFVDTAEWGRVYLREITVAEADQQAEDTDDGKNKNAIARGAARVICDKDGVRLFDPDNEEDVALLASQPWNLLSKVLERKATKANDPGN